MHPAVRLVPPVILLLGFGLLAISLVSGGAHLFLLFVVPVVTGASLTFYVGTLLVVLGFLSLPLMSVGDDERFGVPHRSQRPPPASSTGSSDAGGGLVLIGPFPIFFGGWKSVSTRTRWLAALAGAVLLSLGIYLGFVLSR